jgi:tRNA A37 methylthiotransferase MiaB
VPDHVARFRAKALRHLIDRKNESFRRGLVGRILDVLTLEDASAISNNFIRVSLPSGFPVNEWMRVLVTALETNGVQAVAIPAY